MEKKETLSQLLGHSESVTVDYKGSGFRNGKGVLYVEFSKDDYTDEQLQTIAEELCSSIGHQIHYQKMLDLTNSYRQSKDQEGLDTSEGLSPIDLRKAFLQSGGGDYILVGAPGFDVVNKQQALEDLEKYEILSNREKGKLALRGQDSPSGKPHIDIQCDMSRGHGGKRLASTLKSILGGFFSKENIKGLDEYEPAYLYDKPVDPGDGMT